MDCDICANKFNKGTRSVVKCGACDFECCKECMRTYLEQSTSLPHCMNCKVRLSYNFMVRHLNRSWMNDSYKNSLATIFTGKQIGLMPETQPFVEVELQRRNIVKETNQYKAELKTIYKRARKLEQAIRANGYKLRGEDVPEVLRNELVSNSSIVIDSMKKFIMACPLDQCRGFLSTQYVCGTCQKSICSECLTLKLDDHVCNELDRLSAEIIKKETKACPTCGTRIYKIDGCDQMYCTAIHNGMHCNTAFSWKTRQIEQNIHNPHYYELMRQKGVQFRNVGDVQCGGVPSARGLVRALEHFKDRIYLGDMRSYLVRLHRRISELVQYVTTTYRARVRDHDETLKNIRIKYMLKEMSYDDFSNTIYKLEYNHQKLLDIQQVLELFGISGIEALITITERTPVLPDVEWERIIEDEPNIPMIFKDHLDKTLHNLHQVRHYGNEQFKQIGITYNCSVPEYNETFEFTNVKYKMNGEKMK